jgi:hypothetical protein
MTHQHASVFRELGLQGKLAILLRFNGSGEAITGAVHLEHELKIKISV